MNILIVDDSQERHDGFSKKFGNTNDMHYCYNYKQGVYVLTNSQVDVLFLDHDLGEGKTGYDLAMWLEQQISTGRVVSPKTIYIHSMNPIGARNIQEVFPDAILCPGCWLDPMESNESGE